VMEPNHPLDGGANDSSALAVRHFVCHGKMSVSVR
jgi:hypothetical protein